MRFPQQDARALGAVALGIPLVVAAALAAFAWPAARLEPRNLPIGVAGARAPALEQRLTRDGDRFDVHRYRDEAAAREAIRARDVYGAVVAGTDRTTLLTASAASPVVAQLLEEAFASGGRVRVTDVVPADADDPRGIALASLALPLTLVGVAVGAIAAFSMRSAPGRAAALAGAAVLAGLVAVAVAQGWLGVIRGDWWLNAGILALVVLAVGSLVAGLGTLLGHRGLAVAAALLVLCGNAWAGIATAPELLPEWIGFTGQLLPPGAGGALLRSGAFFDGSGSAVPLTVLLVWAAVGAAALGVAARRDRQPTGEAGRR